MEFPLVLTFVDKVKNPETNKIENKYKFFKLEQLFTPLTETDKEGLFDVDQKQNMGIGNKAVYSEFKLVGSMQQNAMSGLYGPRTEYDLLQEAIQAQQPLTGIDRLADQATKSAEDVADRIASTNVAERHFGSNTQVEADQNKMTVKDDSGKTVDLEKLQQMSEDNKDMHTGQERIIPENKRVDVSKFYKYNAMNAKSSVPGEFTEVVDFYTNLSRFQKANLAKPISEGGLNILNVEALIEELNDPNNQYTESQFIEQLKSCYK